MADEKCGKCGTTMSGGSCGACRIWDKVEEQLKRDSDIASKNEGNKKKP